MCSIEKAMAKVEGDRDSNRDKSLSETGKAFNIALQVVDEVQDALEGVDYEEEDSIVA
jgi:hypothetical protein